MEITVRKSLKNIDILEKQVNHEFQPFVKVLRAIKEVKEACFGPTLKPNYQTAIDDFEQAWYDIYIEFEIAFSNKCHVIIEHVPQVIKRTGKSLYYSSEQVVEASHAKFDKLWQRYKVLDLGQRTDLFRIVFFLHFLKVLSSQIYHKNFF